MTKYKIEWVQRARVIAVVEAESAEEAEARVWSEGLGAVVSAAVENGSILVTEQKEENR